MAKIYGVDIEFYAISCTANPDVCQADNVHLYPQIKLFGKGNGTGTAISHWQVHCFTALKMFGVDLPNDLEQPAVATPAVLRKDAETVQHVHDARTKKQIYDDAFLSFDFAMRNSIFMSNGPLPKTSASVFEKWVELLANTLPPTWKLHNALDALSARIDEVTADESKLVAIMDEHGPETKNWSPGCSAGYTCGLWELFHIMSISVVEWNQMSFIDDSVFTAEAAADTLHDYIVEFFACDVCRRHFMSDYAKCEHDRCNRLGNSTDDLDEWMEFPLWLWEVHNAVRVRLMHEKADREHRKASQADEIAAQWPSRDDCPACWHLDGSWDDEIVYKYIRLTYWIEDSVSESYRRDLMFHHERQQAKLRGDDDDDKKSKHRRLLLLCQIVIGAVMLMGFVILKKKVEKARTGRHKKDDYARGVNYRQRASTRRADEYVA